MPGSGLDGRMFFFPVFSCGHGVREAVAGRAAGATLIVEPSRRFAPKEGPIKPHELELRFFFGVFFSSALSHLLCRELVGIAAAV